METAEATSPAPDAAQPAGALDESLLAPKPAEAEPQKEPEAPEAPKPAEPFDFTKVELPEGLEVPDDAKSAFTELATKHGITQDAAKELFGMYSQQAQKLAESAYSEFAKQNEQWVAEIKADKDLGGDKLEGNLAQIAKVIDQYGGAELKAALNYTGGGNHPAVFRFMLNVAKALNEGGHISGTAPAQSKVIPTVAEAMYPNLKG